MRCVVTGGAGFLGSHVTAHLLAAGHAVIVFDDLSGGSIANIPRGADFTNINCADVTAPMLSGVDAVFHLAANAAEGLSLFTPSESARRNLLAASRMISAAVEAGVERFVFTSSMAVYGHNPDLPFRESQVLAPSDPYGVNKRAVEDLLGIYAREFGLKTVIWRPHNVYGIRQRLDDPYRNVVGIWMTRLRQGKPVRIFGDGSSQRAFTSVDDVAPVIAASAFNEKCWGRTMNIGSERPVTLADLASRMHRIWGVAAPPEHLPPRPADVKTAWCDSALAKRHAGFVERADLDVELKRVSDWVREQPESAFRYLADAELEITRNVPPVWREGRG